VCQTMVPQTPALQATHRVLLRVPFAPAYVTLRAARGAELRPLQVRPALLAPGQTVCLASAGRGGRKSPQGRPGQADPTATPSTTPVGPTTTPSATSDGHWPDACLEERASLPQRHVPRLALRPSSLPAPTERVPRSVPSRVPVLSASVPPPCSGLPDCFGGEFPPVPPRTPGSGPRPPMFWAFGPAPASGRKAGAPLSRCDWIPLRVK